MDQQDMAAGPGAWLAGAREQAGWSLMQVADQLHLDVAAVKALEAGQFEALGAAVYARGHLRRYAGLLGLPVEEVERAFLELHPARSTPDLRHGAGLLQKSDAAGVALRPRTAALGAVVLVIVGLVLWARRVPHAGDAPEPHTTPQPATAAATASKPVLAPVPSQVPNMSVGGGEAMNAMVPASAPTDSALLGAPLSSRLLPAAKTDSSSVRLIGQPAPLSDAMLDSAAQRSAVDGGGGVTNAPAKSPARGHGTRQ